MESILCILYSFLKIGKLGVQCFKRCANRSWNDVQIGAETKKLWPFEDNRIKLCGNFAAQSPFRSCEMSCETHLWHMSAIFQPMPPSSQLRTTLQNHLQAANEVANHLQVVKSHSTCKIKVQTWKMDNSTCEIHLCNLRFLLPTKLDFFSRYFV